MCIIREQFVSVRMRTLDQQTSGCHVMLWCGGDVYSSHWLELIVTYRVKHTFVIYG